MLSKDIIEETYNEVVTLMDVYSPSQPLGSLCFHLHRFLCTERMNSVQKKMNYLPLSSELDWNVSSIRSRFTSVLSVDTAAGTADSQ